MLPSKTPPGGAKMNGFFVQLPSLDERIEGLELKLGEGLTKEERQMFEEELDVLLDMKNMNTPPPPPLPKFKLTGTLNANAPIPEPPSLEDRPSRVPRDDWGRAQRMFMVVYGRVAVREKPNLRAERVDILTRHQYIPIERETDHWVKIRGGGWVLKAQQKYGQLIVPVKQQHYEKKYIAATTVLMFENGKMVSPFLMPGQQGGGDSANDDSKENEEDGVGRIMKRIVVAPSNKKHDKIATQVQSRNVSNFIFLNKQKRQALEEAKRMELASIPTPPPKGWEMLLHRPSGKMYYASLHTNEVRWTMPPPPSTMK